MQLKACSWGLCASSFFLGAPKVPRKEHCESGRPPARTQKEKVVLKKAFAAGAVVRTSAGIPLSAAPAAAHAGAWTSGNGSNASGNIAYLTSSLS
ncbi:hypothetical protein GCM10028793_48410 [Nocardiopsis oceani]